MQECNQDINRAHTVWLEKIRSKVAFVADNEEHYVPSIDALNLHWKRVCWVAQMWDCAAKTTIPTNDVTEFGWEVKDGEIKVVWDSEGNFQKCDNLVKYWTKLTACLHPICSSLFLLLLFEDLQELILFDVIDIMSMLGIFFSSDERNN